MTANKKIHESRGDRIFAIINYILLLSLIHI